MNNPRAIIAGASAGVLGACIWAAIAYYANIQSGWVAWGIGAAVGAAMLGVAKEASLPLGVIAVVITIISICGGKYAAIHLDLQKFKAESGFGDIRAFFDNEEYVISFVADAVAAEHQADGQTVDWPAGVDPDYAEGQADYPPNIWAEAIERWQAMTETEKENLKEFHIARQEAGFADFESQAMSEGFKESFSLFDLLFFGLGVFTSFKIAGTGQDS